MTADEVVSLRGATLKQLRAFSLVARQLSFVQAAAALHLTPSAVSLQIKELETALGLALFVRHGKTVALTAAGQALLSDVHRALAALKDADDTLGRLRGMERTRVCIGMVSNAKYFVPRLLAEFHRERRDIELRITVGNREQLLEQLRRGEIEFAVMGSPPGELEVRARSFAAQPLGIIAAPDHDLAGVRSVPPHALAHRDFIIREPGSGTRAAMERYFHDVSIEPPRILEVTGNEAIKQAVMAKMGLAFLSLHTAGAELQQHALVALDVVGLPLLRNWFVVELSVTTLGDAASALREFILEHGKATIEQQFEPPVVSPPLVTGTASMAGRA